MDTRQLKTFVAIAETGSFAGAAEVVNLTPSAVSQQIHALETEIGSEIFDRSVRPPKLNAHGLHLLDAARQMIGIEEDATAFISGRQQHGTISLGSVRSSISTILPPALSQLSSEFPGLRIKLRTGLSDEMLQDVALGRLDAAIVAEHASFPPRIRWQPFIREPLFVIAPKGTPILSASEILKSRPFIRFRSDVPLAHIIDTELSRAGLVLQPEMEIDSVSDIVACVAHGLGVSIVPNIALSDPMSKDLARMQFGWPQAYRQIGLADRMTNTRTLVLEALHANLAKLSGRYGIHR